ncbi:hypothetical protein L1987_77362 [Smallanthus sonchifolius]|uniref:Uncharacterized protein n=1 Tax=Smallanthus sonchifolius TaxID=185202 RepID=A0ACB8Z9C4_9ASTR|nr:hypothetical protein L1987_77362 [Smallanthus sonchifolius]
MAQSCGFNGGNLLGRIAVVVNFDGSVTKPFVFQNGWMKLGNDMDKPAASLHLKVRTEPDPRFLFQFGGEPECSPVVFQIQGNIRQPVFSCKFSADRNSRSRSLPSDFTMNNINRGWMPTVEGEGKASKPMVQVGVQHVTCMADAALFIALSAAIDLSMDACMLFSRKLRKEFLQDEQDFLS